MALSNKSLHTKDNSIHQLFFECNTKVKELLEMPSEVLEQSDIDLLLEQLSKNVQLMTQAQAKHVEAHFYSHVLQWDALWGLATVYLWYSQWGPAIAQHLFAAHADQTIQDAYPKLTPLVNAIYTFVKQELLLCQLPKKKNNSYCQVGLGVYGSHQACV